MLLSQITGPQDLRGLSYDEIDDLCIEIREFIIESVSNSGGHLGSNLGIVELTVAVHRVFDSPRDVVLFDTGHQAYVHKLLTGRASEFDTLRKAGGLSGYPSRSESEHDWVENSHASTVLSWAHGLATAEHLTGPPRRRICAVIGDGALTGGMAFEGLNNLGHYGRHVTIILNDNGRSYAPTVSKLGESLARLRINPTYVKQATRVERLLAEVPRVGSELERAIEATKAAVREMWEPTSFFENLGVFYTGPFDGHDVAGIEQAIRHADQLNRPTVVHVRTEKGRGFAPAENDAVKRMHDTGPFLSDGAAKPKQRVAKPQKATANYTKAFTEALLKAGEEHPNLVAITAAMPDSTGVLPFAERYPERCIDVGIAEQHAVGSAAGMAMGGLKPVVALYSTFLTRAIDQVNLDVGLHQLPVVFCLDRAGITGPDGPSHHGILDMVLLSKVPNMTILAPSSVQELTVMFNDALELDGPVALRWPRTPGPVVGDHDVGVGLRGRRVRAGGPDKDLCILAVGKMVEAANDAAELLAADGIEATVWDVRCANPLDVDMLGDAATHRVVVTVEDGLAAGGIGESARSQIMAVATAPNTAVAAADNTAVPTADNTAVPTADNTAVADVVVLGVPTTYLAHGDPDEILAELGLDAAGIAASARSRLARHR